MDDRKVNRARGTDWYRSDEQQELFPLRNEEMDEQMRHEIAALKQSPSIEIGTDLVTDVVIPILHRLNNVAFSSSVED